MFLPVTAVGETNYFLPKTYLILPEQSAVKINWILAPESKNYLPKESGKKFKFAIDFKNEPILLYEDKLLINPTTGYIVSLQEPVKEMVCLDNGVMLFSNAEQIGYLVVEKNDKLIPIAKIKPIAKLPFKNSKIFKGDETLYAVSFNSKAKKYEVFVFNNKTNLFEKVLNFNEPIKAVSGKGRNIYFALGKQVIEYKNGTIKYIYEHPREEIQDLMYNEISGLFYKTSKGVGMIKDNGAIEFLQTEEAIVFLKNTSLYVFFPNVGGILELKNIDDLRNFGFKVIKVIDIQQTL
ncbi:hypothetical protein JCM13991_04170 [Thermodesulfovibrio hydrogeniphilus]